MPSLMDFLTAPVTFHRWHVIAIMGLVIYQSSTIFEQALEIRAHRLITRAFVNLNPELVAELEAVDAMEAVMNIELVID